MAHPAARISASCELSSCSRVETRAYPYNGMVVFALNYLTLETQPTVSAVDLAMTAVMNGPRAVERDGAAAAARDRETELAVQINFLALDEFLGAAEATREWSAITATAAAADHRTVPRLGCGPRLGRSGSGLLGRRRCYDPPGKRRARGPVEQCRPHLPRLDRGRCGSQWIGPIPG